MIKQEDCTIIIPHFGNSDSAENALDLCMESLNETVPDMKKILVINGDECNNEFHKADIRIKAQGQNKAVNAAVATTNTPWIFITNDDMIYAPGWWEKLTEEMDINQLNSVSPRLVEPRQGAPTFIEYFCGGAGGDFDKQKFLKFVEDYEETTELHDRKGFNLPLLISRKLWNTIEGYDINYDPWGSNGDSDLEYKIKLAGVQSIQDQDCLVYHFSQTSGTFHPDNRPYWQKNWDYFIEKWGFERASSPEIWTADFKIPKENKYHPEWEGKYK